MKILIYSKAFAPSIGGVETYTGELAFGLAAEAHQVAVVTRTPQGKHPDDAEPYQIVRRPGMLRLMWSIWHVDVVHVAGAAIMPMLLSLLARRLFVVEHHNYQSICLNGLLLRHPEMVACDGRYMRGDYRACLQCQRSEWSRGVAWRRFLLMPLRRWLCRRAAANIGVTDHVRRRVNLPNDDYIYHGLPEQAPVPVVGAKPEDRPLQFAYVGRMVSEKGLFTLIEAARELQAAGHRFVLKMVGDGPLLAKLQNAASELPQVKFTGFIPPKQLPDVVAETDVLVLPSIWEETAGLVAIEQMHRGRAVIAADIGGLSEIVGDTARKFLPGSVATLVDAMSYYLKKPEAVEKDGKAGLARARTLFSNRQMVQQHLDLYRRLLVQP